jgi:hypothetical protein
MDRDTAGKKDGDRDRDTAKKDGDRDGGKDVKLSSEERTKISKTIRSKDVDLRRVERTRVNFNISVGVAIPRSFELYPLPAPIVAVVPAYRGYLYIVVGDDLLIVHPSTYEIVAIIPA